jgi:hypothetical protein
MLVDSEVQGDGKVEWSEGSQSLIEDVVMLNRPQKGKPEPAIVGTCQR